MESLFTVLNYETGETDDISMVELDDHDSKTPRNQGKATVRPVPRQLSRGVVRRARRRRLGKPKRRAGPRLSGTKDVPWPCAGCGAVNKEADKLCAKCRRVRVRREGEGRALGGWAAYAVRSLASATTGPANGATSAQATSAASELCTVVDTLYEHCVGSMSASQWALGLALLGTFYEESVDPFGRDLTVQPDDEEARGHRHFELPEGCPDVAELARSARFSAAAYGAMMDALLSPSHSTVSELLTSLPPDHPRRIAAMTSMHNRLLPGPGGPTILSFSLASSVASPAWILATDPSTLSLTLAFRGTSSAADLVTDLMGVPVPFEEASFLLDDGEEENAVGTEPTDDEDQPPFPDPGVVFVHDGFLRAARQMLSRILPHLDAGFEAHPGFSLRLTGHSYGGAVAILFLILLLTLRPKWRMRCIVFGCPCILDARAARSPILQRYVTTVVLQDDMVPRLSAASLRGLRRTIEVLLEQTNSGFARLFQLAAGNGLSRGISNRISDLLSIPTEPDMDLVRETIATLGTGAEENMWTLCPPGRIIHLTYKAWPSDTTSDTTSPWLSLFLSHPWAFTTLRVSLSMYTDHFPHHYLSAMQSLERISLKSSGFSYANNEGVQ